MFDALGIYALGEVPVSATASTGTGGGGSSGGGSATGGGGKRKFTTMFQPGRRQAFRPPRPNRGGGWNPDKKEEAPLTGVVQNMKAAQGEERLARSIEKGMRKGLVREHKFRWTTLKRGTVGYKELDELVFLTNGRVIAISVKGQGFVHRGTRAEEQDKINEALQIQTLKKMGYAVNRVESIADTELATQELADKAARKLGIYR